MANTNTITLQINADGSKAIQELGGVKKSVFELNDTIKSHLLLITSLVSAYKLFDTIKSVTMLAARYETLGVAMNTVGSNLGYTRQQLASFEESLQKTGITMIESRNNLTRMAQAQIDLAKSSELARIAQDAAVIGNINSSEAFSRMIYGIQSGQVEVLRTIGINVSFEQSYKKLARELGVTTDQLTEYAKMQARVNSVLEAGKQIVGVYEASMTTAGKQLNSMKRYIENIQVKLGEVFQEGLLVSVLILTDNLKALSKELDSFKEAGFINEFANTLRASFYTAIDVVFQLGRALTNLADKLVSIGQIAWKAVAIPFTLMTNPWNLGKILNEQDTVGAWLAQVEKGTQQRLKDWDERIKNLREMAEGKNITINNEAIKKRLEIEKKLRETIKESQKMTTASATKSQADEIINIMQDIEARKALIGKTSTEQELLRLDHKHNEEIKKLIKHKANQAQLEKALEIQRLEWLEKHKEIEEKAYQEKMKKDWDYYIWKQKLYEDIEKTANDWATKEMDRELKLLEQKEKLKQQELSIKKDTYKKTWEMQFDMVNAVGGELGKGLGMMSMGLKGIVDIETGYDPYTEELARLTQHHLDKIQLLKESRASQAEINKAWDEFELQEEQIKNEKKLAMAKSMFQGLSGLAYSFYQLSNNQNKAAFNAYKAFAIAEATIATYEAANKAMASFKGTPFGMAYAAMIIATGLARVAQIARMKPGGTATATSGGNYKYTEPNLSQFEEAKKEETLKTPAINVHIYGNVVDHDAFARELVPSLSKAFQDGVK